MILLIIKGILGALFLVGTYCIVGNILNFPLFYLWYKRRTNFISNISYIFLSIYALIFLYFFGIYFTIFSFALNQYSNRIFSISIVFVFVSLIGGHLFNENNKLRNLAIENDLKIRISLLDFFEYKNKHYILVMTKYGYTLWIFYVALEILRKNLTSLSLGLNDFLLKHYF
jgi:hypothetical protein